MTQLDQEVNKQKKVEKIEQFLAVVLNNTVNCRVPIRMHDKENPTKKITKSNKKNGVFYVGICRNRYQKNIQFQKLDI